MSIIKNEIPILEFDTEQTAVINPTHEKLDLKLPKKCVFAFLGEYITEYASKAEAVKVSEFLSMTKSYPIYVLKYKGEEITLCEAPVGAAPAAQILDWLIGYGVREIISAGSCGALERFPESTFLVPCKALRDEGTSYHYIEPSREITCHQAILETAVAILTEKGVPFTTGKTWTTDAMYRETPDMIEQRRSEGCLAVEMEAAAFFAVSKFYDIPLVQLLYAGDDVSGSSWDSRNWNTQKSIRANLIQCAVELIMQL